jgi:benzodiazapine receptor
MPLHFAFHPLRPQRLSRRGRNPGSPLWFTHDVQHCRRLRPSPFRATLITLPTIVGIGFLMGQLSNSGYGNDWFDALAKPSAMPPGWVFGAAWSFLYMLLAIALALVWAAPSSSARSTGLSLFLAQLVLNFAWSPMFFAWHQVGFALGMILVMLALSVAAATGFARVRRSAAVLMLPYLGWLAFASYLNFEIMRLNP